MKKIILLLTAVTFLLSAQAQNGKGYTINGTIQGVDTGKVYLSTYGGETKGPDSTMLKNGKFSFKGTLPSPQLCFVQLGEQPRSSVGFFLENVPVQITADKDSLYAGVVTGSASNKLYKEWLEQWAAIHNKAGDLYKRSNVANKAKDSAEMKAVTAAFADLDTELDNKVTAFVKKYPTSAVSAMVIVERYINYSYPVKAAAAFALLKPPAKECVYGLMIKASMDKYAKMSVGASPRLSLPDTTGKLVKLTDYKGKVVMVDFWASWCGPCRKENPNVVKAYQRFHDKGFEIIGVSLDTDKKAWLKALNADGLTWTHVSDLKGWKSAPILEYGIAGIPASFIVDRNGKIIAQNLRGEELEKKLEEVFGK